MKLNLNKENKENLKKLEIILKAAVPGFLNLVISESLTLVSKDLLAGISEKLKESIKKQIQKEIKKH